MSHHIITPLFSECWSYSIIIVSFSAPEAQRETVFVCAACNSSLIKLQWDGKSVLSLSGQREVINCSPPSPSPSYWSPHTCLHFHVKAHNICQDTSCVEFQDPPSFPVTSLRSYLWWLWDFCCNMLHISCFNSQWRTGPSESMRLNTEHNCSKIKGLCFSPLLSRGK